MPQTTQENMLQLLPHQLCVGMFVELPQGWMNHPFLRNKFLLKNQQQVQKLKQSSLKHIMVNLARSELPRTWSQPETEPVIAQVTDIAHPKPSVEDPKESDELPAWNPDSLVPERLQDALHDKKMPPEQRSQAVYEHSREMMSRLLEAPTAENLKASKTVIASVADTILSDDETSNHILRITSHDFYTYTHSINVGLTSIMAAKALLGQSDAHDMHELAAGFFLHDLGKVKVRADVINKPGRLDDDEMKHMRTHPYQGYKLLKDADAISEECRIIMLQHHERDDGTGYPKRLAGDEIHIYGKICCIADVFDALTAERSYKKALPTFEALALMKEQMSSHFDKDLFAKFVMLMR